MKNPWLTHRQAKDWNNNIRTWDIVTNFNDRVDKETMVLALKEAAHG